MGAIGTRFQQTFARYMARIGTSTTLTRVTTTAYSPATSTATVTPTTYTVRGVYDAQQNNQFESERGTDTRSKSRVFLIPSLDTSSQALAFEPAVGDKLVIGGRTERIEYSEPEVADGVIVYHRLYLESA
jgi:hypothetical protein